MWSYMKIEGWESQQITVLSEQSISVLSFSSSFSENMFDFLCHNLPDIYSIKM